MTKEDTFTMEGVEAIDLSEATNTEDTATDTAVAEKKQSDDGDGLSSFADAFADAMDGDAAKTEETPEPESEAKEEKEEKGTKESRS